MMLSYDIIKNMRLPYRGVAFATTAEGKNHPFHTFVGLIRWLDEIRKIVILSKPGCPNLIATGLLNSGMLIIERNANRIVIFK